MANNQLTATSGSGSQTTTQSPQMSSGSTANTEQSSVVQPGTATTLLTSTGGLQLHATQLPTVSLNNTTATVQDTKPTAPATHHVNAGLIGVSVILFVVAVALFWATSRSAKNTTV